MLQKNEAITKTTIQHFDRLPNGNEVKLNVDVKIKSKRGGWWITEKNTFAYVMKVEYTMLDEVKTIYVVAEATSVDEKGEVQLSKPTQINHIPKTRQKTGWKNIQHYYKEYGKL